MALTTLKIAVFAPMPRASVTTATAVNPGDLHSMRVARRKSCQQVSTKDTQPAERTSAFAVSRLPRSRRTARSASFWLRPSLILTSAAVLKKLRSSSSSSPSTRFFWKSDRNPLTVLRSMHITPFPWLTRRAAPRLTRSPFPRFSAWTSRLSMTLPKF